jgi:hypothetical protein
MTFIDDPEFDKITEKISYLASSMTDAAIQASMAGLGGCKELNYDTFPEWQQRYIRSYVENESQDSIGLFLQAYEQLKQESK